MPQFDPAASMDLTDDPVRQRLLRKALETFRRGDGGPVLEEMAREVLTGRVSLREACLVPAYAEATIDRAGEFRRRWAAMSDSERHVLAREGELETERERDRMREERASRYAR
ncbi:MULTISPECIES: hypothetical protein [Streptomyces]|uniref:Uncharacterized protein n=1 Tax=Streptomyces xanthii TaxID=2768069 RepID=A0A7H1B5I3_9ACTN|nr:hypothetical protein [Streptomyces xanthii]QNS03988.1 hypothetical protein IAG42_10375 [Streptomyces xanthii]